MRRELLFQNHIIDSYRLAGGHARKWASEWQAHNPDLICSLAPYGVHLIEVKHIPTFGPGAGARVKNALTMGQRLECKKYKQAGGVVLAGVIGSSSDARGSYMAVFRPDDEHWLRDSVIWFPYVLSTKFDIRGLLEEGIRL